MERLLRALLRWGNAGAVANVGHDLAVDRERQAAAARLGERIEGSPPAAVGARAA